VVQLSPDLHRALLAVRGRGVLRLLAQGSLTKYVADSLGISAKTVETYRARLMMKLRIDALAGLVRFAIRAGIAPVE
jgi:FixJ family two-component response regulator